MPKIFNENLEPLTRADLEEKTRNILSTDAVLVENAALLDSVPGIGPVAKAMPVVEMP